MSFELIDSIAVTCVGLQRRDQKQGAERERRYQGLRRKNGRGAERHKKEEKRDEKDRV